MGDWDCHESLPFETRKRQDAIENLVIIGIAGAVKGWALVVRGPRARRGTRTRESDGVTRLRIQFLTLVVLATVLGPFLAGAPRTSAHEATPEATPVATPGAALPETARGPAIPEQGYLVEEVWDRLYWVTEGSYQAMFLTTGEGVIVVDAPPSIGENLLAAIAEVTDEPVTHVVYTHTHADHIGVAHLFPDDATYIAHEATAAQLAERNDPNRPVPTVTFAESYELIVGDQTLELAYQGNNHEPGNTFVYAPRQKVLMVVDIVFPGWVPFQDLALAEDVPGYVAAHDEILTYDFETFVGGHLTRLGTREDVEVQQACTDATLAEWGGRLGGAEIYTFGRCWTMMESLRID